MEFVGILGGVDWLGEVIGISGLGVSRVDEVVYGGLLVIKGVLSGGLHVM